MSLSNFSNKDRRLREVTRFFKMASVAHDLNTCYSVVCWHGGVGGTLLRPLTIQLWEFSSVTSEILLWSKHLRKASVSDFHFLSTSSGRALKLDFPPLYSLLLAPRRFSSDNLHFWKASHAPCIGKLTAECPLCSTRRPSDSLNTFTWTRRHLCLQRKQWRDYSSSSGYSAPRSRIAGMKSRDSGMRIAPTQTLPRIIPIILFPDWFQTNMPLVFYCLKPSWCHVWNSIGHSWSVWFWSGSLLYQVQVWLASRLSQQDNPMAFSLAFFPWAAY